MAHTFAFLLVHVVFSTKERRPWLDESTRPAMHAYLGGIARELDAPALAVNGTTDHVHLFLSVAPKHAVADLVRVLKTNSALWLHRERGNTHAGFARQDGYGVFSVSRSGREEVIAYITGQEEHHRVHTFEEEFMNLLRRHGIAYDKRFIFG